MPGSLSTPPGKAMRLTFHGAQVTATRTQHLGSGQAWCLSGVRNSLHSILVRVLSSTACGRLPERCIWLSVSARDLNTAPLRASSMEEGGHGSSWPQPDALTLELLAKNFSQRREDALSQQELQVRLRFVQVKRRLSTGAGPSPQMLLDQRESMPKEQWRHWEKLGKDVYKQRKRARRAGGPSRARGQDADQATSSLPAASMFPSVKPEGKIALRTSRAPMSGAGSVASSASRARSVSRGKGVKRLSPTHTAHDALPEPAQASPTLWPSAAHFDATAGERARPPAALSLHQQSCDVEPKLGRTSPPPRRPAGQPTLVQRTEAFNAAMAAKRASTPASPHRPDRMNSYHHTIGVPAPSASRDGFQYHSGYERPGWMAGDGVMQKKWGHLSPTRAFGAQRQPQAARPPRPGAAGRSIGHRLHSAQTASSRRKAQGGTKAVEESKAAPVGQGSRSASAPRHASKHRALSARGSSSQPRTRRHSGPKTALQTMKHMSSLTKPGKAEGEDEWGLPRGEVQVSSPQPAHASPDTQLTSPQGMSAALQALTSVARSVVGNLSDDSARVPRSDSQQGSPRESVSPVIRAASTPQEAVGALQAHTRVHQLTDSLERERERRARAEALAAGAEAARKRTFAGLQALRQRVQDTRRALATLRAESVAGVHAAVADTREMCDEILLVVHSAARGAGEARAQQAPPPRSRSRPTVAKADQAVPAVGSHEVGQAQEPSYSAESAWAAPMPAVPAATWKAAHISASGDLHTLASSPLDDFMPPHEVTALSPAPDAAFEQPPPRSPVQSLEEHVDAKALTAGSPKEAAVPASTPAWAQAGSAHEAPHSEPESVAVESPSQFPTAASGLVCTAIALLEDGEDPLSGSVLGLSSGEVLLRRGQGIESVAVDGVHAVGGLADDADADVAEALPDVVLGASASCAALLQPVHGEDLHTGLQHVFDGHPALCSVVAPSSACLSSWAFGEGQGFAYELSRWLWRMIRKVGSILPEPPRVAIDADACTSTGQATLLPAATTDAPDDVRDRQHFDQLLHCIAQQAAKVPWDAVSIRIRLSITLPGSDTVQVSSFTLFLLPTAGAQAHQLPAAFLQALTANSTRRAQQIAGLAASEHSSPSLFRDLPAAVGACLQPAANVALLGLLPTTAPAAGLSSVLSMLGQARASHLAQHLKAQK